MNKVGILMIINQREEIGFLVQLNSEFSNLVVSAKKLHHQLIATKSAKLRIIKVVL